MRFRTALLLGPLLLILGMATATVVAVSIIIDRAAQRRVTDDLHRSLGVFRELQLYRQSLLLANGQVLADEPRLKAVLDTVDISAATVDEVVRDLGEMLDVERFTLIDAAGVVLADVHSPETAGMDLGSHPLVAKALQEGRAHGLWADEQHVYQMHVERIAFGDEIIGAVLLGYLLDDDMAEAVYGLTASAVVIQHGKHAVALSHLRPDHSGRPRALVRALEAVPTGAREPTELSIAGVRYLAVAAPLADHAGDDSLRYAVLQSLDRALTPGRALQRLLFVAVLLALPAAVLLAIWLSRRLSRPIDSLVSFTEDIASGRLHIRARAEGAVELRALSRAMNDMAATLEQSQHDLAIKERLEQEMKIAASIQAALLPRDLEVPGLDVAATMISATEVGGDYYDVLPQQPCWLAIGDVAGHGVPAGLVMVMVQSVLSAVVQMRPHASPSEICCEINRVLVANVRHRLDRDEYVTLTLLCYEPDGRVTFAGAHEDIVLWRAQTGRCETLATPGTWLAVMPDIDRFMTDQDLTMEPGDVMVLYTDGVTEARSSDGEQFGIDRLCAAVERASGADSAAVCEQIIADVDAWSAARDDDITVLVVRRP